MDLSSVLAMVCVVKRVVWTRLLTHVSLLVQDTAGCEHVEWTDDNERHMSHTLVMQTDRPVWSWQNEWRWRFMILQPDVLGQALRGPMHELSAIDFSKFGVEPKTIPLPGVTLLWELVTDAARKDAVLGERIFATRAMAAVTAYKWHSMRHIFVFLVGLYALYVVLARFPRVCLVASC